MNIVVLGAGAVGGYFGGKLAYNGFSVQFLVRKNRYEQLKSRGLNVKSRHGDFSVQPNLVTNVNDIDHPDIVIVALKNYHIDNAFQQLEQLVEKGATILPLLNGIKHLDLLISKFGKEKVLGGLCYIEATLNEEGDVIQTSQLQDIMFGSISQSHSNLLNKLEAMMKESGINGSQSEVILEEMWKKYIFLTSLSSITASTRQPIGVSLQDPVTSSFLKDLISEVFEIAKARNIPLPVDTVDNVFKKLHSLSPTMTASMHRDLEKSLPIELDSLQGYLIEQAQEYGINTPCIKAIYALLHPYKNGGITIQS